MPNNVEKGEVLEDIVSGLKCMDKNATEHTSNESIGIERPSSVHVAQTSLDENVFSEAKQACGSTIDSDITAFALQSALMPMCDREEHEEGEEEEEELDDREGEASIEKTKTSSKASDFLYCDEPASDISLHQLTFTYSADDIDQSSTNEIEESDIESYEFHDIVIDSFPSRCIGVRLHKESLQVVSITDSEAGSTWCVNDQIIAAQNQKVSNYADWLSIVSDHEQQCKNAQITITVHRRKAAESSMAEKAILGMVGGIAGGGAFALGCSALVGGGWLVAAASLVPLSLGGVSGTAVGARRNSAPAAFFSGALAGFVGPTATTAFLGGELAVEACTDASEVDI